MKLAHEELLLARLEDVLDEPAVVDVGAVEADAERLLDFDRGSRAEGLGHLPGALAPVAGGHGGHGKRKRHEIEGECKRRPPPSLQSHGRRPDQRR